MKEVSKEEAIGKTLKDIRPYNMGTGILLEFTDNTRTFLMADNQIEEVT